ncbi:hypothetical protein JI739_09200 [Ramlibacter sp. AW1]|uniref:Uncharacterized protein n=1 Tax=Ramlibacter aurantiacus TaxID=2801330 RepID=A0A937D733_9BURK|nr:hypothetical protein [Ramlibacter aurantiacus]MBL0420516.1 hypothetical protein [Ramlibacter aurantiacus]
MANIIASGTTEASSSEFTLTTDSANIYITGGAPGSDARALVQIKAADGTFSTVGELTKQFPAQLLTGAGTYRVTRVATATAFGVDKN